MRPGETREQEAAEGQAGEVGRQHDRERVAPRAEELDEQLRPDDLVPERNPPRGRIDGERDADVTRACREIGRAVRSLR
jgi:hypothetical protein